MSKWLGKCASCSKWIRNDDTGYYDYADHSELMCRRCSSRYTSRGPESPIEHRFLECWQRHYPGVYLQPQFWIHDFRVDFALPQALIVIELDGAAAHSSPWNVERDQVRQQYIEGLGFYFIRFTGSEINRDTDGCVHRAAYEIACRLTQGAAS